MKCRELAEFLIDYVSGELPDETRVHFELHLTRCRNCHAYLISTKHGDGGQDRVRRE